MSTLAQLTLAVAAGALAIPASRKMIIGTIKQDWLYNQLELDRIEEDGITVSTKEGIRTRIIHVRGVNYDAKVFETQDQLLKIRAEMIHKIGSSGVEIRLHAVKRDRDESFHAEWPNKVLKEIGDAEKKRFQSSYQTNWYIIISGKNLDDAAEAIFTSLDEYKPKYLKTCKEGYCPLTGFLNGLVSGDYRQDLSIISQQLSGCLPASDLHFNRAGQITAHTPNPYFYKIIAVRTWPEMANGVVQHEIMSLQAELEINQICKPLSNGTTRALFGRKQKELTTEIFGIPLGSDQAVTETEAAMQLLSDNQATLFETQYQIVVRAQTEEELASHIKVITRILGRNQITYNIEAVGSATCWFNRLPGHGKLVRPLKLFDKSIAALWPFHYAAPGRHGSPYGNLPVRLLTTPSGQTYRFQFHVKNKPQSLGNYLVFAPSGSGKSTLLMHLLSGLAKFGNVPAYVFDSNEGARFMIEAFGGNYQGYDQLALNPLDCGDDTDRNRHRITTIIRAMLGDFEEDGMEDIISTMLDMAFAVDPPHRTFNELFQASFPKNSKVRNRFADWVNVPEIGLKGLYSHVFNAAHDSLSSVLNQSHLIGINMNEALKDERLGPPVVAHISQAIREAAKTKHGFNIFIDEAANLLQNDGFRHFAMEMYREFRKLNGAVGLAFQDPSALAKSGIADAVLDNTSTLIFFPNANASIESLAPFNLNGEQLDFCRGGPASKGGRRVLIVQRDAADGISESAIVDVDLTPLTDILRFYRAGTDANRHLAALKARWGAQWQQHL